MRRIISAVFIISLFLSLFACDAPRVTENAENSRVYFDYFDTWGTLYDYSGMDYGEFSAVADEVEKILKDYHELSDIYNTYEGKNNLATLNLMAGKGPVELDSRLIDMLEYSKEIHEITNGETNVAFGAVLKIWHEHRTEGSKKPQLASLPDIELLREASEHADIDKMIINRETGTVELLDAKMSIDVGAVAKGYTVEVIAKYLESRGFTSMVIDMGGNLRAVGSRPDGSPFAAGVKSPFEEGKYAASFEISSEALVTSGGYLRFYTVDGVSYHHIIDKETLFPKNDYASVSVKAPSSALADALSTALFNMEISEAEALISTLEGVSAVFVKSNGEIVNVNR